MLVSDSESRPLHHRGISLVNAVTGSRVPDPGSVTSRIQDLARCKGRIQDLAHWRIRIQDPATGWTALLPLRQCTRPAAQLGDFEMRTLQRPEFLFC